MAKNLNNIIARSQRLMLDENWNRQVEMGAAAQRAGSLNGKNNGGNDLAALEAMAFGSPAPSAGVTYNPIPENFSMPKNRMTDDGKPIQILQEQHTPIDRSNSKIPKAILESFEKTASPIADGMSMLKPPASYYTQQPVTEQRYTPQPQPQYTPQQAAGGIDYGYIKYMIEEAVGNAMRTRLDESMNLAEMKGMRIGPGSVIQLLDKNGNLYEGKLTLKKKAN